jgi:hypothetical protein
MPHHFTKNTVSAVFWCKPCGRDTEHLVQGGRRGACKVCLAKLEREHEEREAAAAAVEPAAEQMGLFGGSAS